MSTTVLLIRHAAHDRLGETLCGRMPGIGLGEAGREQARRLAEHLAGAQLSAVFSGPLQRARETAAPIAEMAGTEVVTDADLNEIDVGEWTGRRFEELQGDPAWTRWNRLRHISRPPKGESMLEVQVRIARFLRALQDRFPGATVAAVGHADVIKSALARVLGLSLEFHDRFEIGPASISRVVLGAWGAKVLGVNAEVAAWP